ncbi:acetyltransferase [Croceicoccus mobilis]|uniref:Acetyltransferase n=2 Tax=Croceicoccus mobilis TaxID=1703339 RepID=A0A916ZA63_9SPHN|nr:acetyltransferase [Croceicoccus mobilis]
MSRSGTPVGEDERATPVLRLAVPGDAEAVRALIRLSTDVLLARVLPPEQVAASHLFMALDTQLLADGTYFAVEVDGVLAGCGGWSRRATNFGGDQSEGRNPRLLNPATEPARIRAMYTHPDFTRLGIGRMILKAGEDAARAEGFNTIQLHATMGGMPLYRACGFREIAHETASGVPIVHMMKDL